MLPCFSFIGPTGVKMVVNCLPLYQPPDEEAQASTDSHLEPLSPSHNNDSNGRSKLIKARSMESISSSQLGDDEGQHDAKTVGEVATPPRRKSTKFSHYSVTVHNVSASNVVATAQPAASNEGEKHEEKQQSMDDDSSEVKSQIIDAPQSNGEVSAETTGDADKAKENDGKKTDEGVSSSDETAAAGSSDVAQAEIEESTNTEKANENSSNESKEAKQEKQETSQNDDLVRDGSAAEGESEPTEAENKFETLEVKSKPEVNDSESEQQKHMKLQKTRSERASLSPDGDLSDSEHNGFSVNYVQDPFVVPQLKRSSGSVSFYAPNIPAVATVETIAISSAHNIRDDTLLETSTENKLESTSLEKTEEASTTADKTDGASGEDEVATREKSLSTAKPLILVETDSILQQSASSGPTAPTQTSLSPTTSSPPSSPEAKTHAPPIAIQATPLPGPPVTLDKDYTERSGWLNKLSHRKGMFGDKWQKRYFVLHRSWLYYFKKYGVSVMPVRINKPST